MFPYDLFRAVKARIPNPWRPAPPPAPHEPGTWLVVVEPYCDSDEFPVGAVVRFAARLRDHPMGDRLAWRPAEHEPMLVVARDGVEDFYPPRCLAAVPRDVALAWGATPPARYAPAVDLDPGRSPLGRHFRVDAEHGPFRPAAVGRCVEDNRPTGTLGVAAVRGSAFARVPLDRLTPVPDSAWAGGSPPSEWTPPGAGPAPDDPEAQAEADFTLDRGDDPDDDASDGPAPFAEGEWLVVLPGWVCDDPDDFEPGFLPGAVVAFDGMVDRDDAHVDPAGVAWDCGVRRGEVVDEFRRDYLRPATATELAAWEAGGVVPLYVEDPAGAGAEARRMLADLCSAHGLACQHDADRFNGLDRLLLFGRAAVDGLAEIRRRGLGVSDREYRGLWYEGKPDGERPRWPLDALEGQAAVVAAVVDRLGQAVADRAAAANSAVVVATIRESLTAGRPTIAAMAGACPTDATAACAAVGAVLGRLDGVEAFARRVLADRNAARGRADALHDLVVALAEAIDGPAPDMAPPLALRLADPEGRADLVRSLLLRVGRMKGAERLAHQSREAMKAIAAALEVAGPFEASCRAGDYDAAVEWVVNMAKVVQALAHSPAVLKEAARQIAAGGPLSGSALDAAAVAALAPEAEAGSEAKPLATWLPEPGRWTRVAEAEPGDYFKADMIVRVVETFGLLGPNPGAMIRRDNIQGPAQLNRLEPVPDEVLAAWGDDVPLVARGPWPEVLAASADRTPLADDEDEDGPKLPPEFPHPAGAYFRLLAEAPPSPGDEFARAGVGAVVRFAGHVGTVGPWLLLASQPEAGAALAQAVATPTGQFVGRHLAAHRDGLLTWARPGDLAPIPAADVAAWGGRVPAEAQVDEGGSLRYRFE